MEFFPQYLTAFALTAVLIMLLRRPGLAIGLVDHPGGRKRHTRPVPLIGGLVMFMVFVVIVAWLFPIPARPYGSLLVGMTLMVAAGAFDDLYEISALSRLLLQVIAAGLMASWGGIRVDTMGDLFAAGDIELAIFTVPFTVLCVVALINAINMSDGFDGLAGGIVLSALVWLGVVAGIAGVNGVSVPMLISLACAVLGFLVFNMRNPWRRRASVFMGDAGSMMLGFAVAWFAVYISQTQTADIPPITIAWILALPIHDTATVIIRRLRRGRSPFEPGRDHIHHAMFRARIKVMHTTWILTGVAIVYGAIGVIGWRLGIPEYWMFGGFIAMGFVQLWFTRSGWALLRRKRVKA